MEELVEKEFIKKHLVNYVNDVQGCKAIDAICHVTATVYKTRPEYASSLSSFLSIIDELIQNGDLIEIEYVISRISYRIKSFLLPGGTVVKIK